MNKIKTYFKNIRFAAIAILPMFLVQCDTVPEIHDPELDEYQIAEYIESHKESFSEFNTFMEKTGLSAVLSTRGPFTLFLPTNDAMFAYYEEVGKGSASDFTIDEMITLVRNHIIGVEISTSDIGLGSLREKNALGDYLVSEFSGSDIIINKYSKITDRDVFVSNGVIHIVNGTIKPVVDNCYDVVKSLEGYSIFAEGLEVSGLKDTLSIIEIPYGQQTARTRFSLLAVSDSVYQSKGVNSVNDLISLYDDKNGELSDLQNGFYQYMVYHILQGTNFMSDMENGTYYVITHENYVNVNVDEDFLLNEKDSVSGNTRLIVRHSNIPCKNGVIHSIGNTLEPIEPEAKEFIFYTTHYPDLQNHKAYGTEIRNFTDGENTFAGIKWGGDYMQYYWKPGQNYENSDCLSMSDGFWWLELTIPKITKGHYKVYGYFKEWNNRANLVAYMDGIKFDTVLELNTSSLGYVELEIGEVTWETTREHKIKLVTIYPGVLYWDYLRFEPVVE